MVTLIEILQPNIIPPKTIQ